MYDKLKAELEVARPNSSEQEPGAVETFKKELAQQLTSVIKAVKKHSKKLKRARDCCEDETRLGLKTVGRRKLTSKEAKPIGNIQFRRAKSDVYGLVEPESGENFLRELSDLETEWFQELLNDFARAAPKELEIVPLDNGSFHTTGKLQVPENIIQLFQPAHAPQLNPRERLWEHLKRFLSWEIFPNTA